jgi:hypothetical protein
MIDGQDRLDVLVAQPYIGVEKTLEAVVGERDVFESRFD